MSKFYCNGQDGEGYYVVDHDEARDGIYPCQSNRGANEMVNTLNKIAAGERVKVIEECIRFILNGHFLHDQAPAKLFATELTTEMRRQLIP